MLQNYILFLWGNPAGAEKDQEAAFDMVHKQLELQQRTGIAEGESLLQVSVESFNAFMSVAQGTVRQCF